MRFQNGLFFICVNVLVLPFFLMNIAYVACSAPTIKISRANAKILLHRPSGFIFPNSNFVCRIITIENDLRKDKIHLCGRDSVWAGLVIVW